MNQVYLIMVYFGLSKDESGNSTHLVSTVELVVAVMCKRGLSFAVIYAVSQLKLNIGLVCYLTL